jgi:DNA-binding NtrC family response regulator
MSGMDLLRALRERAPELDVLLMTAYGDVQDAIDAMKAGAYDYLLKPLDIDQLEQILGRWGSERASRGGIDGDDLSAAIVRGSHRLVGRDPQMLDIFKTVGTVASTNAPVLIRGETGTGKEMIARSIHANGLNPDAPFVAVNCTAIPESLLESELFGHMRGAFTSAVSDRKGRFELAGTGTIFLDEIGDTELPFQAKLLRVLQEREFYPVGSERPRETRARVIAATHQPLEEMVAAGHFREDLYFRLRVLEIQVPPLRERVGDIPLLVNHILNKVAREHRRPVPTVPDSVMAVILARRWPGNVRELENALTRAVLLAKRGVISLDNLDLAEPAGSRDPAAAAAPAAPAAPMQLKHLEEVERDYVRQVLEMFRGNKRTAARVLGVSRPRLDRMIARFSL